MPRIVRRGCDDCRAGRPSTSLMDTWYRVTVVGPDAGTLATWTVSGPGHPDLAVVERLARLLLTARRRGRRVVVTDVCPELAELIELVGLRREMGWDTEGGEEVLGVEEGVEAADPPA